MGSSWYLWILAMSLFLILAGVKKKRHTAYIRHRMLREKREEEKRIMKELAQRFIGKDCYINLLDGHVDGIIQEVTDGGIVIENKGSIQAVNLDYVLKIREYPYKKGKRATFLSD